MSRPSAGAEPMTSLVGRPDAFISYAREDAELAETLCTRLKDGGQTIWIDKEGVRFSESWREKARAGIHAAKATILILTPDWLRSEACAWEAKHAVEVHKKVVPIAVAPAPDPRTLPGPVRDRKWIPLDPATIDQATIDRILQTLAADLEWRDKQAELQVAADRWNAKERSWSALLRRRELPDAEQWLARQGGHEETATELQVEFILASRRLQRQWQLWAIGVLSAALLVLAGVALFAEWQRRRAVANQRTAESRALATMAIERAPFDPGLAALLSLEAFGRDRTEQAQAALRRAVLATPLDVLAAELPTIGSPAISDDGRRVAAVSPNEIHVWRLGGDRRTTVLPAGGEFAGNLTFSPDGRLLAWQTSEGGGHGHLYDLERRRELNVRADLPAFAALDFPRGRVAVTRQVGHALWPYRSVVEIRPLDGEGSRVTLRPSAVDGFTRVIFSHDGRWVAAAQADGRIRVFGSDGLADVVAVRGPEPIIPPKNSAPIPTLADLGFSPDDRRLLALDTDGAIWSWDRARGGLPWMTDPPKGTTGGLDLSPDGTVAAGTSGARDEPRIWSVQNGRAVRTVTSRNSDQIARSAARGLDKAALSRGGRRAVSIGADSSVRVWDLTPSDDVDLRDDTHFTTVDVAISPAGSKVASIGEPGEVKLWSVRDGASAIRLNVGRSSLRTVAFSDDGRLVAAAGYDSAIRIWRAADGAPLRVLGTPRRPATDWSKPTWGPDVVNDIALGGHGRLLASAVDDGVIRLWDLRGPRSPRLLRGHRGAVRAVAVSRDGTGVVSAGTDGTIRLWPTSGGSSRLVGRFPSRTAFRDVIVSDDGARVGLVSGRTLRIWNTTGSGDPLILHGGRVELLRAGFIPDGSGMVAIGDDGLLRIWSPSGLTEGTMPVPRPTNGLGAAAIASNGRIVFAGGGTTVRVQTCIACRSLDRVHAAVKARAVRRLTPSERQLYLSR